MAKRLQVILKDPEYREIQRVARSRHMSLAEWVRQALESARRQEPLGSAGKKFDSIRIAMQHEYPSGEVEDILAEIEAGYGVGPRS
jgi:16S rRNA C1402 N4-methylase RsmH